LAYYYYKSQELYSFLVASIRKERKKKF